MICRQCGINNPEGTSVCSGCGASLVTTNSANYGMQNSMQNGVPVNNASSVPAVDPGKAFAITSLVCGIAAFFVAGIILGILAIVFGGVAKSKGTTSGMATAGIVLGVIAVVVMIIALVIIGSNFGFLF